MPIQTNLDVFENFHGINERVSVHDGSFTPNSEALMLTSFQGIFLYTIGVDEKNNTFKFNSKTTPTEFYPVQFIGPRNLTNEANLPLRFNRRPFSLNIISTGNIKDDENGKYTIVVTDPLGSKAADFYLDNPQNPNFSPEQVIVPGGIVSVHELNLNKNNPQREIAFNYLSTGVGAGQIGVCWSLYRNGIVYVSNTVSGTLSSMSLDLTSGLMQVSEAAVDVPVPIGTEPFFGLELPEMPIPSAPLDMRIREDGKYLYTIEGIAGSISSYRIDGNGNMKVVDVTEPIADFDRHNEISSREYPELSARQAAQWPNYFSQHAVQGIT
eukprot:Awhi_evm2s5784